MSTVSPELARFLSSLVGAELDYARAYTEHLAVGDVEPAAPANVDPVLLADIRSRLHAEWRRRVRYGFQPEQLGGLPKGGAPR